MASNNSLDRDVSHQNSPTMLSQAMLGVGRCSRAVNPSSPLDLAPNSLAQATAGHVQIVGDWLPILPIPFHSFFSFSRGSPMDLPGETAMTMSSQMVSQREEEVPKGRICPPIAGIFFAGLRSRLELFATSTWVIKCPH